MTREDKITMIKGMHLIIMSMNNEDAYMSWIVDMPDCPTEDDFEWFADSENQESFDDLINKFIYLSRRYLRAGMIIDSSLYTGD